MKFGDYLKDNPQYRDKNGEPLELVEWACLMEDMKYRRIGSDEIGDYWVSTVWLGIISPLGGLFETMIFKKKDGVVDYAELYVWRYNTREEAEAGHEYACKFIQAEETDGKEEEEEEGV